MKTIKTLNYDTIAQYYDGGYEGFFFMGEDKQVSKIIAYDTGRVLDIGCGTGSSIEIIGVKNEDYLGIDISSKSIEIAKQKYPTYSFVCSSILDINIGIEYEYALCLYGVMNYLKDDEIARVIASAKKFIMMDYSDGYHPICYPNNVFPTRAFSKEKYEKYYAGKFNNYDIYCDEQTKSHFLMLENL